MVVSSTRITYRSETALLAQATPRRYPHAGAARASRCRQGAQSAAPGQCCLAPLTDVQHLDTPLMELGDQLLRLGGQWSTTVRMVMWSARATWESRRRKTTWGLLWLESRTLTWILWTGCVSYKIAYALVMLASVTCYVLSRQRLRLKRIWNITWKWFRLNVW